MFGICEDGVATLIARFVTPMSVRSNQPIYSSDTLSLKRSVTRRSAQRWEIEANLEPLNLTSNDLFTKFITKGYDSAITVLMPQAMGIVTRYQSANPVVAATGTCSANVAIWATAANITTTGVINKGTFIKFSNHNKIYMTTTLKASGTGIAVSFYPNLQVAITTGTTVTCYNNVLGSFLLDLDSIRGMSYTDGILMDNGTIKLVEKL